MIASRSDANNTQALYRVLYTGHATVHVEGCRLLARVKRENTRTRWLWADGRPFSEIYSADAPWNLACRVCGGGMKVGGENQ